MRFKGKTGCFVLNVNEHKPAAPGPE
jgi:hypothetical protein